MDGYVESFGPALVSVNRLVDGRECNILETFRTSTGLPISGGGPRGLPKLEVLQNDDFLKYIFQQALSQGSIWNLPPFSYATWARNFGTYTNAKNKIDDSVLRSQF